MATLAIIARARPATHAEQAQQAITLPRLQHMARLRMMLNKTSSRQKVVPSSSSSRRTAHPVKRPGACFLVAEPPPLSQYLFPFSLPPPPPRHKSRGFAVKSRSAAAAEQKL